MKFDKFKKKDKLKVNLVPLIDIIFVTLIFFLVLYRFSSFNPAEFSENAENLTQGDLSKTFELENTKIIEVDFNARIFINHNQIEENTISNLKRQIPSPKDTNCILLVDDNVSYEEFGKLVNNLESIGVKKISFIE
jgi:biopolymer transport protein ExbD